MATVQTFMHMRASMATVCICGFHALSSSSSCSSWFGIRLQYHYLQSFLNGINDWLPKLMLVYRISVCCFSSSIEFHFSSSGYMHKCKFLAFFPSKPTEDIAPKVKASPRITSRNLFAEIRQLATVWSRDLPPPRITPSFKKHDSNWHGSPALQHSESQPILLHLWQQMPWCTRRVAM